MLVLASGSPRRRDILTHAGIPHLVRPAEVDESVLPGEGPTAYVIRLARAKATAAKAGDSDVVLGADTVVVADGEIMGKPAGPGDARRMLKRLAGREHSVITGICLHCAGKSAEAAEETRVRFVPMEDDEIEAYVASGEPMDKAGAYAIQGLASKFIDRIEGCYFNVVGLPVARVYLLLRQFEYPQIGM